MHKIKRGQIVKFHTPNVDEDPNQVYIVLEVFEDGDRSRAKIEALNIGLSFASTYIVLTRDLEEHISKTKLLDNYSRKDNRLLQQY